MTLTLVALFGGLGSVVRYLLEYAVRRRHPVARPWATVLANALGCLAAGWITYRLTGPSDVRLHTIALTGFCGGLTTFSSAFAVPALLQREHHWGYAAALVVATPVVCVAAFALGGSL